MQRFGVALVLVLGGAIQVSTDLGVLSATARENAFKGATGRGLTSKGRPYKDE